MKLIMLVCGIAAMLCGAAAWADKPQRGPIVAYEEFGIEAADCGDFKIMEDYRVEEQQIQYFNSDGSLSRILYKQRYVYDVVYNSEEPSYSLAGKGAEAMRWLYFEDGVPTWAVGVNNDFNFTAPGIGVVFRRHWRVVLDWATFEVLFSKGPNDTDPLNVEKLCAALRP